VIAKGIETFKAAEEKPKLRNLWQSAMVF